MKFSSEQNIIKKRRRVFVCLKKLLVCGLVAGLLLGTSSFFDSGVSAHRMTYRQAHSKAGDLLIKNYTNKYFLLRNASSQNINNMFITGKELNLISHGSEGGEFNIKCAFEGDIVIKNCVTNREIVRLWLSTEHYCFLLYNRIYKLIALYSPEKNDSWQGGNREQIRGANPSLKTVEEDRVMRFAQ